MAADLIIHLMGYPTEELKQFLYLSWQRILPRSIDLPRHISLISYLDLLPFQVFGIFLAEGKQKLSIPLLKQREKIEWFEKGLDMYQETGIRMTQWVILHARRCEFDRREIRQWTSS